MHVYIVILFLPSLDVIASISSTLEYSSEMEHQETIVAEQGYDSSLMSSMSDFI